MDIATEIINIALYSLLVSSSASGMESRIDLKHEGDIIERKRPQSINDKHKIGKLRIRTG